MKKSSLRGRTPFKPGKALRKVRPETAKANADLRRLTQYLMSKRAHDRCEIRATPECHERNYRPDWRGLSPQHIILRAQGRIDTAGNILIGCGDCHNHQRYATGTPLSRDQQLVLVDRLNKQYRIRGGLDGRQL